MKLKKLLALLLALVMVFALAACGDDVSNDDDDDDDDDDKVSTSMSSDPTGTTDSIGTPVIPDNKDPVGPAVPVVDTVAGEWETAVETTGATMGAEGFNGTFSLVIDLTFDADGDYLVDVNEDKTLASMDAAFDKALADYVFDTLMTMVESEEEADALCQDQYGMNARAFAESCVPELKGMLQEMMVEMVTIGEYEQVDGKLYMDDEEVTFSKEGQTLKLSADELDMDDVGVDELVFTLVNATPQNIDPKDYGVEEPLPPAEAIVGQWECFLFQDGADMGLDDFEGLMAYELNYEFKADGTFTMKPDSDAILESAKQFEEDLVQYMVDMMYAQFAESDMTKEEADAAMVDNYGMGVVDYCQKQIADYNMSGQMNEVLKNMDMSGTYTIAGDKLTLIDASGAKQVFTFEQMDNDCFQLDGDDTQFEELMRQLGEEYMYLFRAE